MIIISSIKYNITIDRLFYRLETIILLVLSINYNGQKCYPQCKIK